MKCERLMTCNHVGLGLKKIIVYVTFSMGFSILFAQPKVKFGLRDYENILPVEKVSYHDTLKIPFLICKDKGTFLSGIKVNHQKVYVNLEGVQYSDSLIALKKELKMHLVCIGSKEFNSFNTIIELEFIGKDSSRFQKKFFIKPYIELFDNSCSDSVIKLSKSEGSERDVLMFNQYGTITFVKVYKEGNLMFEGDYFNTNILEFDLKKNGVGEYNVHYQTHNSNCELMISYQ